MSNNLEYAEILQTQLDLQLVQQATSGWMENNAAQVRYFGGNEVKIPKNSMTGLGDYNRDEGKYPQGSVSLTYESRKLTKDRAAQFYFDRNDVDETNYLTEAAALMAQFQAEHVIPEIDAYRYSEIAKNAIAYGNVSEYSPNKENIVATILSVIRKIQDLTGLARNELVITMPFTTFEILEQTEEFIRSVSVSQFMKGDISVEVSSINGIPIIPVVSERMKTKYIFADGETEFGFKPAPDAEKITFMVTPLSAPIAISKTDALKIFSPDINQDGDGWKTQYRKYHDLWLKDNSLPAIWVATEQ